MATEARTKYAQYFSQVASPYTLPREILDGFAASNGTAPADLFRTVDSTSYPVPLLFATDQHKPEVLIAPFNHGLPGVAGAKKYAISGDISNGGQVPDLRELVADHFYLAPTVTVRTSATMGAEWAAHPTDDLLPGHQAVGDGLEEVRTRRSVPIPHAYVAAILEGREQGSLTWRWLWNTVCQPVVSNPEELAAYGSFLDFVRVSSTKRHGEETAATEQALPLAAVTGGVRDQALTLAVRFLPGLSGTLGLGAQMLQVQAQMQQHERTLLASNVKPPETLQRKYPALYDILVRVCETTTESNFGPYWTQHLQLPKATGWLGAMETTLGRIARNLQYEPPIISPLLSTDLGSG